MPTALPQRQLLARLAQRGQCRIASTQSPRLPCQQKSTPRQRPALTRPAQGFRAFSASSRLLRELQTPPHTSAAAAAATTPSTPPAPSAAGPPSPTEPPKPDTPPPPPRRRPRWILATLLLLFGATIGTGVRAVLAPPPPLLPGSSADASLIADIRDTASRLAVVRRLQADPEFSRDHEAYAGLPVDDDAARARRLTTGALAGSRGVGAYQHVWRNNVTGEVVAVVYFGTGTIGWPGVVHGGVIGTILDEHSARAAWRDLGGDKGKGLLTASLDITYRRPTLSSDFYVIRASAVPEDMLPLNERGKRERKVWVDAVVETPEGRVCVESRALFVAPKAGGLRPVPENF